MSNANTKSIEGQSTMEQWLQVRKEEGARINPEIAEVDWTYGQILDPYDVRPNLPDECFQIGRIYFARSPGNDIWVHFGDLPDDTRKRLWERHRSNLAFPAGFELFLSL